MGRSVVLIPSCYPPVLRRFGGHDEVVLMLSLDLPGLQQNRCIAPTEIDIRTAAFSLVSFQQIVVLNSFAICVLAALALRLKMGAEESSVVRLYRYAEQ
jgi:hypothetical protein